MALRPIPPTVRWAFTGFMAILVPVYLGTYGPSNFLYFCDVALLLTLAAVQTGWALPASMAAVGILLPQAAWLVDFLCGFFGPCPLGIAAYMFDPGIPRFARALSLFHGWLPILLVYLVWRLGYDRRALVGWTATAWVLLVVCYLYAPRPPAPPEQPNLPVNINYVHGFGDLPQVWMPPWAWLAMLLVGLPTLVFWPTHWLLRRFAPPAR